MSKSMHRTALAFFLLVVAITGIVLLARVIYYGRNRVDAASMLRLAKENWQAGNFPNATRKYMTATRLILEGGIRFMAAQPFVEKSSKLEQQGKLPQALDYCIKAVRTLGPYDDEGSYDNNCMTLN